MTNLTVLNKFHNAFNPTKLIAESTQWCMTKKKEMLERLSDVNDLLATKGQLTREERTDLTAERNKIERDLVKKDPAFISNHAFDTWLSTEGLLSGGFSINENRAMNKVRLNRLFIENEENIVITSRGNQYKGFFVMDELAYVLYQTRTFHAVNKETIGNRAKDVNNRLDKVGEDYGLDRVFIAKLQTPIRITAGRHKNEVAESVDIRQTLLEHTNLVEEQQQKLIDAGGDDIEVAI